jgi:hypothetical protein
MAEVVDAILHTEPRRPSALNPSVPPQFDRVVAKAMAKDPRKRFANAADLDAALARLTPGRRRARPPVTANRSARDWAGVVEAGGAFRRALAQAATSR